MDLSVRTGLATTGQSDTMSVIAYMQHLHKAVFQGGKKERERDTISISKPSVALKPNLKQV